MYQKEDLVQIFEKEKLFDVESWYDSLKEYTFETEFLPLTIEEAICIIQKYRRDVIKRQGEYYIQNEEEVLLGLQEKIEQKMMYMKRCFIRLSTRSPKDAVLELKESKEYIQAELEKYISGISDINQILSKIQPKDNSNAFVQDDLLNALNNDQYNEVLKIIFHCTSKLLSVDNSQRAMYLLTQSERVSSDLRRLLTCQDIELGEKIENTFSEEVRKKQICMVSLRKWEDKLFDEYEFRCFYYNRKLTAISQYNYYIYEQQIQAQEEQDRIKQEIQKIFDKVKDKLPTENGVIDIAVFFRENPVRSLIIELNPFNEYKGAGIIIDNKLFYIQKEFIKIGTGGSLFYWKEDIELLKNGDCVDMRIIKEAKQDILNNYIMFFEGNPQNIIASAIYQQKVAFETNQKKGINCSIY